MRYVGAQIRQQTPTPKNQYEPESVIALDTCNEFG